jgi:hypothetical protein
VPDSLPCPYLNAPVELTEERESHITERHPDLLPRHRDRIATTLSDADQIRRSKRFGEALLFSRWFADLRGGKHVVVVVISEPDIPRHWIVTAYMTRALAGGAIEWARN